MIDTGTSSLQMILHAHFCYKWYDSVTSTWTSSLHWNISLIVDLFVCLGLTSLWNTWGHITTVPACSSGTLTNVLPHRNAMPQTQDTTPHPVTVYRHRANLSLCYPSMWNVTLEYTATHFNVLGETRPGNPSPNFHTHQLTFNLMLSWWSTVGSSVESTVPTGSWTRDLWCANPVRYPLAHSDFLINCRKYTGPFKKIIINLLFLSVFRDQIYYLKRQIWWIYICLLWLNQWTLTKVFISVQG